MFGQTYMELKGWHDKVKRDGHTLHISRFPQRMKSFLPLKVSLSSWFSGLAELFAIMFLMIFQEYPMIRFCCLEYNDEVISDTVSMKLIELNIDPTKPFWYQNGRQLE